MNTDAIIDWLTEHGLTILLILLATLLSYWLLGKLTRSMSVRIQSLDDEDGSELDKRTKTIFSVIRSTGVVVIVGTAVLMILTEFNVPVTPVLASVGFVGLAFGLGAQTLVKDMISGLFILLENQYTVGDTVEISGIIGTVEDMTLRTTELRDFYGAVHIIPNGEIRVVANRTRDWSRAVIDVNITYDVDVDRAVALLEEIGRALQQEAAYAHLLHEAPQVTGVEGLDDWAVRLRIIVKTEANNQWGIQRYLRRQIRDRFAAEGIDLAFPRQDVQIVGK
ncbi:MAG: mechanosensitive ion channel family protein [Chloroflexi bacterium]|nr:mechanosensitive ion channel family protein [Chloroflexota bacterium]